MELGGPVKQKPGFQVAIVSLDGVCALTVCGVYNAEDRERIEAFLTAMKESLLFHTTCLFE